MSTGHLHLMGSTLFLLHQKKKDIHKDVLFLLWSLNTIDVYFSAEKINIFYVWYHKNPHIYLLGCYDTTLTSILQEMKNPLDFRSISLSTPS